MDINTYGACISVAQQRRIIITAVTPNMKYVYKDFGSKTTVYLWWFKDETVEYIKRKQ